LERNKYYSEKGYEYFYKIAPFFIKLLKIKVEGKENVPKEGGLIIASNHRSNLDPFVLNLVAGRPLIFLAKKSLFEIPLLGAFIKGAGAIPVNRNGRDTSSLKKSLKALSDGKSIAIFPEGTRSKPGQFLKPQKGVGLLVSKGNVPVVPTLIEGTDKILPVGGKFPKLFTSDIVVKFGEPVKYNKSHKIDDISLDIMERIKSLRD
jgi:1-acyl-sn-glycerol-3-phosphate acyltransferase